MIERNNFKLENSYKTKDRFYYNLVPVQMCIYVIRNNLENSFRLYVFLKLNNPCGKMKINNKVLEELSISLGVSARTVRNYISRLKSLGWIRKNRKTQYYILHSYDRIRILFDWSARASVEFYREDVSRLRNKLSAVPYLYLHSNIRRKAKKGRSVLLSGGTNHSLLSSSRSKKQKYFPISVLGVEKIFGISRSKASRMKIRAANSGFLRVKKSFEKTELSDIDVRRMGEYDKSLRKSVVYRNGQYQIQRPDLIKPLISLRRRKKLGTYISGYI